MDKYGLNILWTARYDYSKGQKINLHKHDYFQLIYFIDGEGDFFYDDLVIRFQPSHLFFVKPMTSHGFVHNHVQTVKTFDIKFRVTDESLKALFSSANPCYAKCLSEIPLLFEKIRIEGMKKTRYYDVFACSYLLQIVHLLLRMDIHPLETKKEAIISLPKPMSVADKTHCYIKNHFNEELSIKDISQKIGYSESYLNKVFKDNYKCTIAGFIKYVRIQQAKELISYSENTLKQIAEIVGFKNIHHFSRVFKEIEGVTPGHWSNVEKNGIRKNIYFE